MSNGSSPELALLAQYSDVDWPAATDEERSGAVVKLAQVAGFMQAGICHVAPLVQHTEALQCGSWGQPEVGVR